MGRLSKSKSLKYKIEGKNRFKRGNVGKVPANKISLDIDEN